MASRLSIFVDVRHVRVRVSIFLKKFYWISSYLDMASRLSIFVDVRHVRVRVSVFFSKFYWISLYLDMVIFRVYHVYHVFSFFVFIYILPKFCIFLSDFHFFSLFNWISSYLDMVSRLSIFVDVRHVRVRISVHLPIMNLNNRLISSLRQISDD